MIVEDQTLYVFRSSSGAGTYEATFVPVDGGWKIAEVRTLAGGFYGEPFDEYEALLLEVLIAWVLLGEPTPDLRSRLVGLIEGLGDGQSMDETQRSIYFLVMVGVTSAAGQ